MKVYFFGRKTIATLIITAVISGLLIFLKDFNVSEKTIWQFYYEVQKLLGKYFPNDTELKREIQDQLNRKLIEDEQLREYKVRRDVDYALLDYERMEKQNYISNMKNKNILEEIDKIKYTDLQRKIVKNAVYYEFSDGTMGIRGAWVPPDPREIPLE